MYKRTLIIISLLAGFFCAQAETYWPVDTTKNPIRYETNVGQGFVVGTNNAAVEGSIAIGGNESDEKAIVLDAQDAVQVGTGTNTTANTFQFKEWRMTYLFTDTAVSNTTTTSYNAPMAGCILVGKTVGVNEAWISGSSGTASWILITD